MSQASKGRRVFAYAAAHYLGFQVPSARPERGDAKAQKSATRGIKAFHQAIVEGRAPPANGREGRFLWWYQSTLDAWIEKTANGSRRGRKPRAEVADASS